MPPNPCHDHRRETTWRVTIPHRRSAKAIADPDSHLLFRISRFRKGLADNTLGIALVILIFVVPKSRAKLSADMPAILVSLREYLSTGDSKKPGLLISIIGLKLK